MFLYSLHAQPAQRAQRYRWHTNSSRAGSAGQQKQCLMFRLFLVAALHHDVLAGIRNLSILRAQERMQIQLISQQCFPAACVFAAKVFKLFSN